MTQAWANKCILISLDIDWFRDGLVAQFGSGSQAQDLCLNWWS